MSGEVAWSFAKDVTYIQGIVLIAGAERKLEDGSQTKEEREEAERMLERLKYSGLHYVSLYSACRGPDAAIPKKDGAQNWQPWEEDAPLTSVLEGVSGRWSLPKSAVAVVVGEAEAESAQDLVQEGWAVILLSPEAESKSRGAQTSTTAISCADATLTHMGELPAAIARINQKRAGPNRGPVVVAYTMKWSRERSLLERLAFPWLPRPPGVSFVPLHLARPLGPQMDGVHALLHKATDEIRALPVPTAGGAGSMLMGRFGFSAPFETLLRYVEQRPEICMIDPVESIRPILDRHAMQAVLTGLSKIMPPGSPVVVRSPRSAEVSSLDTTEVERAIQQKAVMLPAIVKPQVACGAAEAHTMALVLRPDGFINLKVPTPAVIQEYVDHGGLQHKVYAVGNEVFVSQRRSTPNAISFAVTSAKESGPSAIVFDSLRSLPTAQEGQTDPAHVPGGSTPLDMGAVKAAAKWLQNALGLTIIGFDIVIEDKSGDHVVVDVNYFPSFNDVPNEKALPAFWNALLATINAHRTTLAATKP